MSTAESDRGPITLIEIKYKKDIIGYLANRFLAGLLLLGMFICTSLLMLCVIENLNGGILKVSYRVWFIIGVSLFQLLSITITNIIIVFKKGCYYYLQ